ncbi:MAG: serine/threonine-protein kinase, partial [Akkermansia sp.]|nr:serine/threonine-protein kinase [Akkermansia sp.]
MSTGNSQKNGTAADQNLLALPEGVELGSYRIIHTLGQGGFGITYLAEIIGSGEQVVIKENLPTFCAMRARTGLDVLPTNPKDELQEYAKYLQGFVNEARLLAQLNHPNIVKVIGAFRALGTAYYVMPWVGGRELQKAAPTPADITEKWLLPILGILLSTLEYLHGKNIYHRDVKPSNILLTENGTPVLIDFGTARTIISDRSATHVGSPGYSPIEQLRSKGNPGPWTDVYSLGATCYRLITDEHPPDALDRMEDDDPYIPLAPRTELHGRFSPAFLASIDKALAPRGKDRWQSAAEWRAALPISISTPASPTTPELATAPISVFPEPARNSRFKVPFILVSILLVLVLALGIPGGYMLYRHAQTVGEQRLLTRQESERLAELLQQMHAGLSAAQQEIAPAAERVTAGQQLSEQTSLLQHFDSLRQTAAAAKS